MATIEERAKMSLAIHFEESREVYNKEHKNMREWEYGYCQGATEMIEKAKENFCNHCEWYHPDCESNPCNRLREFRKEMES